MDVLSSMSTIAGYKGVLLAAAALPKMVPLLMTAAGTLKASRFLILGVGVAGLQAIATAKRLGAVVEAFDIRPAVKEQVESLGARFVAHEAIQAGGEAKGGYATELTPEQQARQREVLSKHIADADVVICSALVPGRRAPVLLSDAQVAAMRPGSVVVDLAADQGGNCALTRPARPSSTAACASSAPLNVPSSVPLHASQMLARNFQNFLLHLLKKGELQLDLADEVTAGALITRGGEIVHPAVRSALVGLGVLLRARSRRRLRGRRCAGGRRGRLRRGAFGSSTVMSSALFAVVDLLQLLAPLALDPHLLLRRSSSVELAARDGLVLALAGVLHVRAAGRVLAADRGEVVEGLHLLRQRRAVPGLGECRRQDRARR